MSKRSMDIQGGQDRYGGGNMMEDVPFDTPKVATAAQMAKRKIATMKSKSSARPISPVKPLFSPPVVSQEVNSTNGFNFGQSTTSNFSFSGGAFNPSSNINNTNLTGFNGNIFNIPSNNDDKSIILEKEPYLSSSQQKIVEDIVKPFLPISINQYTKDPIDYLSPDIISQLSNYLKIQQLSSNKNILSLFNKPYRSISQKEWMTDDKRNEINQSISKLNDLQKANLIQIIKDNVEPLKFVDGNSLPSIEYLPNDVQSNMYDFVRKELGITNDKGNNNPFSSVKSFAFNNNNQDVGSNIFNKPTDNTTVDSPFTFTKSADNKTINSPFTFNKDNTTISAPSLFSNKSLEDTMKSPFSSNNEASTTPKGNTSFSFGKPAETPVKSSDTSFSFLKSTETTPKPSDSPFSFTKPAESVTKSADSIFSFNKSTESPSKPTESLSSSNKSSESVFSFNKATDTTPKPSTTPFSFNKTIDATQNQSTTPFSFNKSTEATQKPSTTPFPFKKPTDTTSIPSATPFSFNKTTDATQNPSTTPFFFNNPTETTPNPSNTPFSFNKSSDSTPKPSTTPFSFTKPIEDAPKVSESLFSSIKPVAFPSNPSGSIFSLNKPVESTPKTSDNPFSFIKTSESTPNITSNPFSTTNPTAKPLEASTLFNKASESTSQPFNTPFSFNKPAESVQKPSGTLLTFNKPSESTPNPSATPFGFNKPSNDAPAPVTSQFSFNKPTESSTKPLESIFSVNKPSHDSISSASVSNKSTNQDENILSVRRMIVSLNTAYLHLLSTSPIDHDFTPLAQYYIEEMNEHKKLLNNYIPKKPLSNTATIFQEILNNDAPKFVPKFGNGNTNFMSSFGQQAAKQAAKDKKKRKDEEFDSDEDDEAEWERKDKEKQELKQKELNNSSQKVMKNINGKFEWVDVNAPEMTTSTSIIPPVTFTSPDIIKSSSPNITTFSPANVTTSTISTPENDEDNEPILEQQDLTSLSAHELKTETILFENKARCRKFVKNEKEPWENKGIGMIRLLKNKESSRVKVLMRIIPSGQIIINSYLLPSADMYNSIGDKGVKMVFSDASGQLDTYSITFGTKERAEDLLKGVRGELS